MMKRTFLTTLVGLMGLLASAQDVSVSKALFRQGDDMSWAKFEMDDASWSEIDITTQWDKQGFPQNTHAYGWYRIHVNIPKSVFQGGDQQNALIFNLPKADDVDECFLNGKLIGATGRMPIDAAGYFPASNAVRNYVVDVKRDGVRLDAENVIAVRVYNRGGSGGLYNNPLTISCPKAADGFSMSLKDTNIGQYHYDIEVNNAYLATTTGTLDVTITDRETGTKVNSLTKKLSLKRNKPVRVTVPYTMDKMCQLTATYTDAKTGKVLTESRQLKYVLTPAAPATPRFNGAPVWGVRPGSPVIYRFPVSGERPMKFTCADLPAGLQLSESDGVLSGKIDEAGNLTFTVTAENAKGKASQGFTLKVGADMIGQTPPMGWNSWNCWGLTVTQEKVMASTQALIDKGLADYGYGYINIDDGWEAPERNPDGTLDANEKFPSMKGLADWLHDRGLKFGIYSAPGATTCGGYLGSLDYEKQDAEVWNRWGVDYLKYDWCSYEQVRVRENDWGFASCIRPYLLMQKFLRQQPRDIFYSLGPLGGTQVYLWGLYCDGNSWRTAQDINDTWKSISDVGFRQQAGKAQYSSIGHWNDPDMLVVGKVGYGLGENCDGLRETRLTPDEQYTHITLWTIVSSNMLIGCDIAQMDDFTLSLLCNNEVNAIDQDLLGKQADRVSKEGDIEVWSRPLADGAIAVGIFNVGETDRKVEMKALIPSEKPIKTVRDLWRQKDLSESELNCTIPLHGCRYLKVWFASDHKFQMELTPQDVGALQSDQKRSYQGMCIYEDWLLSLQNTGYATLYKLPSLEKKTATFKLGSFGETNHANVAAFGVEKYDKSDPLPLVYVSQAYRKVVNGEKDVCYVERISLDGKAETVQRIVLDDQQLYGYALQWTVDQQRRHLIGFGNTISNTAEGNRYRIMVFPLPHLSDGEVVHLTANDAIENFFIQDRDTRYPSKVVGQGACVWKNCLLLPTGFGKEDTPSIIYVLDLKTKALRNILDLSETLKDEMEDLDFYQGEAYIQTNGRGVVKVRINGL